MRLFAAPPYHLGYNFMSMKPDDDILDEEIEELVDKILTEEESVEKDAEELAAVGSLVVERAVLNFSGTRTPEQLIELDKFLDQHGTDDDLLDKLSERYPEFLTLLTEEIENYRKEVEKTFGVTQESVVGE